MRFRLFLFAFILIANFCFGSLAVSGNKIIDSKNGKPVALKGYALTNGIFSVWNENENKLEMPKKMKDLKWALIHNDVFRLKKQNVNVVRYCFNYELFAPDNPDSEENYQIFEQHLKWFQEQNIYVVVNLHIFPAFSGSINPTAKSIFECDHCWDKFVGFWLDFINHYKDNDIIAGWEFFNEPFLPIEKLMTESQWYDKLDDFIANARKVDKKHIFFIANPIAKTKSFNKDGSRNVDWSFRQFKRKFRDSNIVYTYHFYEPIHFTHQNTNEYLVKGVRYPLKAYTYKKYLNSAGGNTVVSKGTNGWYKVVVKDIIPPKNADYGNPVLSVAKGEGKYYFDNVEIVEIDKNGRRRKLNLPNPSFVPYRPEIPAVFRRGSYKEEDFLWWTTYYSEKYEQSRIDERIPDYHLEKGIGVDDGYSISMRNDYQAIANWTLDPLQYFIKPKLGATYEISCWVKSRKGNSLWVGISWYKGTPLTYNYKYLDKIILKNIVSFGKRENVPVFVSEFGSVAFAKTVDRAKWTKDVVDVFNKNKLNYTYWAYNGKYGWGYDFGINIKDYKNKEKVLYNYGSIENILKNSFSK